MIGIMLFWLGLNIALDNPPISINDSDVSEGILLKVTNPGRHAGYRTITIESNIGVIEFRTYAIKKTKPLKNRLGETVAIWSYPNRSVFFTKINSVMEIEISGQKILNDWDIVRKRKESSKSTGSVLWKIGVALILFPLFRVYRLVTKKI